MRCVGGDHRQRKLRCGRGHLTPTPGPPRAESAKPTRIATSSNSIALASSSTATGKSSTLRRYPHKHFQDGQAYYWHAEARSRVGSLRGFRYVYAIAHASSLRYFDSGQTGETLVLGIVVANTSLRSRYCIRLLLVVRYVKTAPS